MQLLLLGDSNQRHNSCAPPRDQVDGTRVAGYEVASRQQRAKLQDRRSCEGGRWQAERRAEWRGRLAAWPACYREGSVADARRKQQALHSHGARDRDLE